MKTQISKPARERTGYTKEYKQEALSLWRASGRSAAKVAAELGIRPPLLYRWARLERLPETEQSVGGNRCGWESGSVCESRQIGWTGD